MISEHNKRVYRATIKYDYERGVHIDNIYYEFGEIFSKEEIDKLIKEVE